jgi:hypothetical protein
MSEQNTNQSNASISDVNSAGVDNNVNQQRNDSGNHSFDDNYIASMAAANLRKQAMQKAGGKNSNGSNNVQKPDDKQIQEGDKDKKPQPTATNDDNKKPSDKDNASSGGSGGQSDRTDWKSEASKHQARADKAEARIRDLEKEIETYKESKNLVDEFTKDPVSFVRQHLPSLADDLAAYNDPMKMIENGVSKYASELLQNFKKTYGEDWRYSDTEAITPGTPSFRFRVAIDAKTNELRQQYADYVNKQKAEIENAKKSIEMDRDRLKKDYNLSDDMLAEAEKRLKTEGLSYYNLVRMALFPEILDAKLKAVVPPPDIPSDRAEGVGGSGIGSGGQSKNKLSKEAMKYLSVSGWRP